MDGRIIAIGDGRTGSQRCQPDVDQSECWAGRAVDGKTPTDNPAVDELLRGLNARDIKTRRRAEQMDQAILARAFRGEL